MQIRCKLHYVSAGSNNENEKTDVAEVKIRFF